MFWTTPGKRRPSQITAESQVEDKPHVAEMSWIADRWIKAKIRKGCAPRVRLRRKLQIMWLGTSSPEPRPNVTLRRIPFSREGAPTSTIEVFAQ